MKHRKNKQMPWTSAEVKDFLPYFYKMLRKSNKSLIKVLSETDLFKKYNTEPKFAKLVDTQLNLRIEKARITQGNNGVKGGKISGPALGKWSVESGHLESLRTPEHQSKAGKAAGKVNVESGHWDNFMELGKQWRIDNPELAHQIASNNAKNMNDNMDPEFRKQHNTKVANKLYVLSDSTIVRGAFAKSNHIKQNPDVYVIKDLVQSDTDYSMYETIMIQKKNEIALLKLQPKPCKHCGKLCQPRGLNSHEKNCIKN
jgi:hypothetical protein